MKSFLGILIFLIVFALAGVAMHFGIYKKPGVFIWSVVDGKIVESKIKKSGPKLMRPASEDGKEEVSDESGNETKVAEVEGTAAAPAEKEAPPADPNIISLFDGKELGNWKITQYGGEGDVFVTDDAELEFGFGAILTGVHWDGETPGKSNYELTLEAMKLDGTDFFCAVTFPVKESHASFVIGGWGGGIVGISSVDDLDASENETMNIEGFNEDIWYKIKINVTDDKILAWIDDDLMVDLPLKDRKISLRPGDIELSVPLGLASFQTRSKYRNIVWRKLP